MAEYNKPLPVPDGDTAPYWEAAREGRLMIQQCSSCGRHVFYPRSLCPHCGSEELKWVQASGRGTIHSYTVVHRAPSPAFKEDVPYVVALIDLEEGVRMMSNVLAPASDVKIGARVEVVFDPVTPEITLPKFRLVGGDS